MDLNEIIRFFKKICLNNRAVRGFVDNDYEGRLGKLVGYRSSNAVFHISVLGCYHGGYFDNDGGLVGVSACAAIALGRVPEQVLSGRRLWVHAVLVWENPGRRGDVSLAKLKWFYYLKEKCLTPYLNLFINQQLFNWILRNKYLIYTNCKKTTEFKS